MKSYISTIYLSIVSTCLSVVSVAQEANWYKAENITYCEVRKCTPFSNVLFYSEKGGGNLIKQAAADEKGQFTFTVDKDIPANVLNTKFKNTNGISGTGMVNFYGAKEFSIQNITIKSSRGVNVLKWDAEVNPKEAIHFELKASKDGVNFTKVNELPATSGPSEVPYSFEDNQQEYYFYRIGVVNENKGLRYTSRILSIETQGMNVYPTATSDELHIELDNYTSDDSYRLVNEYGQLIRSGKLIKGSNVIHVNSVAPGNYLIIANSGTKKFTAKIVKL